MSENLQQLLKESLLNNSYDYSSMHDELKKTWMNSYSYLYTLQKSYIGYEELFYYSGDDITRNSKLIGKLYLDKWSYANFDVDCDLIEVYGREAYRTSDMYNRPYTSQEIINHPEIFNKIPIVLIDDKVIWDYKMVSGQDCTTFILPFRRDFVIKLQRDGHTDKIVYIDHKIQVFVIDNRFYERIETQTNRIHHNAISKTFRLDFDLFKEKPPIQEGTMMCSFHFPNALKKNYELGTMLVPLEKTNEGYVGQITDDINIKLHGNTSKFYVSCVFVERLKPHNLYYGSNEVTIDTNGGRCMVIQQDEMVPYKTPIPVENFMIFEKGPLDVGYTIVKNTDILELHYPNIYTFKDEMYKNGYTYKIFYFYHHADDLKYTVLFNFYFKFLSNTFKYYPLEEIIDKIYRDELDYSMYDQEQIDSFKATFNKIISYQYFNHLYGDDDFLRRYIKESGKEDMFPVEYKDETLKTWINVEPNILREYVLEQKKLGDTYHLYTNSINLQSRLRRDTSPEFGTDNMHEFTEDRYVFAMQNVRQYPELLDIRMFIDGLYVMDIYQERKNFTDYLYIPASLVTNDSYIEIEVFPAYVYKKDLTFESLDDVKEIVLDDPVEKIWPTIGDIYFNLQSNVRQRYDKDLFDISEHYTTDLYGDRGTFLVKSDNPDKKPVEFTRLHSFSIKPNDNFVVNVPLTLRFSKNSIIIKIRITKHGVPYLKFDQWNWNYNYEYIRIFRNGRLLPRCKYQINTTYDYPTIMLFDFYEPYDELIIDIAPYRYKEVFYKEELTYQDVLINLKDYITKPFDIRYYEVYMNGRKLSLNNVFHITPWEMTLVNLKSLYNLEIFERERDWEYFGTDYNQNTYYYNLDDLFDSNFITEEMKNKMIKDMIDEQKDPRLTIRPNTNDEEKQDRTDVRKFAQFYIFYHDEFIPKTYSNPDVKQESRAVMEDVYYLIDKEYRRKPYLDSINQKEVDRKYHYPQVVSLDPDIVVGDGNPNNLYYVYPKGHLPDVPEKEYLEEEPGMIIDPDIDKDY